METPNYILKANETVRVPKYPPKEPSAIKKIAWRIIFWMTLCLVAYDLLIYQELDGFTSLFMSILFLWWTFPRQKSGKKTTIWAIVSIIVLFSFIVEDNLFTEVLPPALTIILIPAYLWAIFSVEHSEVLSPFEIWFYDDHLIVYREKHYYNKKVTRKEYDKFFYKDIHKCQYRANTKRINIFGVVEGIWYDYNPDGTLPEKPTYQKTTDSISYFYTSASPEVDFVAEIENHSPIKVIVEEN